MWWDHGEAMAEMEEGRGALRPAMATAALRRLLCCLLRASAEAREKAGNRMRAREGAASAGREMSCCSSTWPERSGRRRRVAPRGDRALKRVGTVDSIS